jgi:hypothetical protein
MTPTLRHERAGITLTEILISILIMGIGLLSLATLFPLGLIRLRAAANDVRSAELAESATSDIQARGLVGKQSFAATWYSINYDPWTYDPTNPANPTVAGGVVRAPAAAIRGLPVCYDPLWFQLAGTKPATTGAADYRFGAGVTAIRVDLDGGPASAYGLQRITNLPSGNQWGPQIVNVSTTAGAITANSWLQMVGSIFASQDDLVFQKASATANVAQGQGNPLALDMSSNGGPSVDWTYTWLFTGQQTDTTNASHFDGDLVVFRNRPFGVDPTTNSGIGERVVEAIFGYSTNVSMSLLNGTTVTGTGFSDNLKTVLLRWPASQPDPDVRVGGFIADITYERNLTVDVSRFQSAAVAGQVELYPGQRCYWYRVTKKTQVEAETGTTSAPTAAGYRRMVVTIDSPVKAKTLLKAGGTPLHVNAALVSPFVVNTFATVINL